VRGNPGGNILAGEYLLRLFTDTEIEPAPVGLRNTLLTQRVAANSHLRQWLPSIELAVETGEPFSQSFPLSDPDTCNEVGRVYPGKTVLLIDAASYSATDFFCAGYQDHGIGKILGATPHTGAGGANVWSYSVLQDHFDDLPGGAPPPLAPLPRGIDMRIAFRRSLRVGATNRGLPVEGLGVSADEVQPRTKRDIEEDDADFFDRAAALLD
jgi:C-terminal processing protease CtpA/Prc